MIRLVIETDKLPVLACSSSGSGCGSDYETEYYTRMAEGEGNTQVPVRTHHRSTRETGQETCGFTDFVSMSYLVTNVTTVLFIGNSYIAV